MEFIALAISGWIIGLIAAIPIGPVNLICIRRTLECGAWYGFVSGLGAALGDGVFATVTGFGLTAIAQLIVGYSTPLQIGGGILLLAVGLRTYFMPPPLKMAESYGPFPQGVNPCIPQKNGAACKNGTNGNRLKTRGMASTFALTITNPATLIFFSGWFATLGGLSDNPSFPAVAFAVLGVFLGSTTWWGTLTYTVGRLHARIDERVVRRINGISGALVTLFGAGLLFHVARTLLMH